MADPSPKKLCFVVGPIGGEGTSIRDHADWLLYGIIMPVMTDYPEFQVKRADHDTRPGLIDVQMINDLLSAELVIADLSLSNPNAFYEIGIRHMTGKPIIHMQLATESIPFDQTLMRTVKFQCTRFADVEKAKADLRSFVGWTLDPDYRSENPVTNARGRLELEQNATPEMRVLMEEMDELKFQMGIMSKRLERTPPERDAAVRFFASEVAGAAGLGSLMPTGAIPGLSLSSAVANINALKPSHALSGVLSNPLSGTTTTPSAIPSNPLSGLATGAPSATDGSKKTS